jgi:hypothetical protein
VATQKVTLTLTDTDLANVEQLTKLMDGRSRAQTVSNSISLTSFVQDALKEGGELLIRKPDGTIERVVAPWFKMKSPAN